MENLDIHQRHMRQCLELAAKSVGICEPNPPVGAIIVSGTAVLASGHTQPVGSAHAEAMAIEAAGRQQIDIAGATMYVTLEPCSHFGRTPPCADAIIAAGIAKVFIGITDPYTEVSGRGIARLRAAGIDVTVGVLADEVSLFMRAYLKRIGSGRPWVICKWAQTLDGRMSTRTGHSKWISSDASRQQVHALRAVCDGILVGAATLAADNPLLTVRGQAGNSSSRPLSRVVLTSQLNIKQDCKLLQTANIAPVIIVCTQEAAGQNTSVVREIEKAGAELLVMPAAANGAGIDLAALLDEFGRRSWTRLLVEGGAAIHSSYMSGGLVDELNVYLAPKLLGDAGGAGITLTPLAETMDKSLQLPAPQVERFEDDLLLQYILNTEVLKQQ